MIRSFVFLVLLALLVVNAGCSHSYDWVVINNSSGTIELKYRAQPYPPEDERGMYLKDNAPVIIALEHFQTAKDKWHKLQAGEYDFENDTGTFSVKLAPSEVLWVDRTTDAPGNDGHFHLASIRISGANGSIELDGKQIQAQFKIESNNYVLRYK
jgi:hypothetical protein